MIYYVMLACCFVSIFYYLFSIYSATRFFRFRPLAAEFHPPISILKPVCGLENITYSNFSTFCHQNYPQYEIIFGVKDPNDPVVPVVQQIIKDFPLLTIQLVICDQKIGENPKVNSLLQMQQHAQHNFLLISDSDISVGPEYLHQIIQPMQNPQVGATTCLYRSSAKNWLQQFEAIENATENVPGVLFNELMANKIGWLGGWSILTSRAILEELGGLYAVKDKVGEDLLLGKLIVEKGYSITICNYVLENHPQNNKFSKIVKRRARWAKGVSSCCFWCYSGCLFIYGTVTSLLFLCASNFSTLGWSIFLTTWMIRIIMSWLIGAKYLHDLNTKKFFWISPLQDFISFSMWLYNFSIKKIYWRGKYFRILAQGEMQLSD